MIEACLNEARAASKYHTEIERGGKRDGERGWESGMKIRTFNRNDSIRPIRIKGEDAPVAGSWRRRRVTPVGPVGYIAKTGAFARGRDSINVIVGSL